MKYINMYIFLINSYVKTLRFVYALRLIISPKIKKTN